MTKLEFEVQVPAPPKGPRARKVRFPDATPAATAQEADAFLATQSEQGGEATIAHTATVDPK